MIIELKAELERVATEIGAIFTSKSNSELQDFVQSFDFTNPLINLKPIETYGQDIIASGAIRYDFRFELFFLTKFAKSDHLEDTKDILIDDMTQLSELFFTTLNKNENRYFINPSWRWTNGILRQYLSNLTCGVQASILIDTACNTVKEAPDVSIQAQAMLDVYTASGATLTGTEESEMIAYIDGLVTDGLYSKVKNESIYWLSGINALVDWVAGVISDNVNNAALSLSGFTLDGATQRILTNFSGGTSNNQYVAVFCFDNASSAANKALFGAQDSDITRIFQDGTNIDGFMQGASMGNTIANNFLDKTLYGLLVEVGSEVQMQEGVTITTVINTTSGVPAISFTVGAVNFATGPFFFFEGTVGNFISADKIGFDELKYRTRLRALAIGLGLTL